MSHPLASFYRGKRVLVTGHTGFVGGWAAQWLKLLGAQVYGYGLPPATRPNFFDASVLDRGMTSVFADLRDRNSLANAFTEFQPEIVLHCASRSNPHLAHREPVETFSSNVMGTVLLLEEVRLTNSVRAIVNASCDAPDANMPSAPDDSSHHIHNSCMGCIELVGSAFASSFFTPRGCALATAFCADSIGGGDWREGRIAPNLVRSLMYGEPVEVTGTAKIRIWHVLDAIYGILLLAQKLFEHGEQYCRRWDFQSTNGGPLSAAEFSKNFVKVWDTIEAGEPSHSSAGFRSAQTNFRKVEPQLGWSNFLDPDEAIFWTVEWYRAFYANSSTAWRTTDEQIDRYIQLTMA